MNLWLHVAATEWPARGGHDGRSMSDLSHAPLHCTLLASVVDAAAGDHVKVYTNSEAASDSKLASPSLPAANLDGASAVVECGE
eukprot:6025140-Pyramimonas_sp.AAC.1